MVCQPSTELFSLTYVRLRRFWQSKATCGGLSNIAEMAGCDIKVRSVLKVPSGFHECRRAVNLAQGLWAPNRSSLEVVIARRQAADPLSGSKNADQVRVPTGLRAVVEARAAWAKNLSKAPRLLIEAMFYMLDGQAVSVAGTEAAELVTFGAVSSGGRRSLP